MPDALCKGWGRVTAWRERRRVARMTPEQRHHYRNQQAYLTLLKKQKRFHE